MKEIWAALSDSEKLEYSSRGAANFERTRAEAIKLSIEATDKMSPEQLRTRSIKAAASQTPEQLRAKALKGNAKLTPEQRSKRALMGWTTRRTKSAR